MSPLDATTSDPTFRSPHTQPTPPSSSTSALPERAPLSLPHIVDFPTPAPSPDQLLAEAYPQSIDPQLQRPHQQSSSHPLGGPLDPRYPPQTAAITPRHLTTATSHFSTGPTQAVPPPRPSQPPIQQTPNPYPHQSLMRSYHDTGSHASNQPPPPTIPPQNQQQYLSQHQQNPAGLQDAFASIRNFPLQPSPAPPPQQQQQQHHTQHQQQHPSHPHHAQTHPHPSHPHHVEPRAMGPPRPIAPDASPQGPPGATFRSMFPGALGGGVGSDSGVESHIAPPSLTTPSQQQPQPLIPGGEGNTRNSNLLGLPPPPSRTPGRGRGSGNTGITPGATAQITPIKDQNGKFPCPHCNKDYLHAKHLKRHLLRHTGDRPYSCVLCNDTFSRSDILKRHFAKCSIRRGNPHGLTHLSHAHAHQRKLKEEKERAAAGTPSTVTSSPGDGKKMVGKACDQCVKLKVKCDLGHPCERCRQKGCECVYSRNQRRQGSMDDLHGLPAPDYHPQLHGHGTGYGDNFFPPPLHHSHIPQHSSHSSIPLTQPRGQPLVGSMPPGLKRNTNPSTDPASFFDPHAPLGPAPGPDDWAGYVQQPYSDPYYNNSEVISHGIGQDSGTGDGMYSMLYQPAASWRFMGGSWPTKPALIPADPLQEKCDRLIDFCAGGTSTPTEDMQMLRTWITPENVKHFVELYLDNFQNHFPLIHVPTFNIALCHNGLLMAVICIGAVYSERGIRHDEVRKCMDYSYSAMINRINDMNVVDGPSRPPEVGDVHAMQLIFVLFTWHGSIQQRQLAKQKYRIVIDMARQANLFQPLTSRDTPADSVSYLHQVFPDAHNDTRKNMWNWAAWIEQERRNRTMFTVYLLDTAFCIYFNVPPRLRTTDIRLPLPADDAAWDARDATECANALGLHSDQQQPDIPSKSRELEFVLALQMLMTPGVPLPYCSTNAFSKFILIHALNAQIWLYQKYNSDPMSMAIDQWIRPLSKVPTVDPYLQTDAKNQMFNNLVSALETWKKAWDEDIVVQCPDPNQRIGFYRDGMPYYWVARRCIQHPLRSQLGFVEEGDDRNVHVAVEMLREAKAYLHRIEQNHGEPAREGAVTKIDQAYGLEELTYDMKLLFRPKSDTDEGDFNQQSGGQTQQAAQRQ